MGLTHVAIRHSALFPGVTTCAVRVKIVSGGLVAQLFHRACHLGMPTSLKQTVQFRMHLTYDVSQIFFPLGKAVFVGINDQ